MSTSADHVWAALTLSAVPSIGLLVGAAAGSFSRMRHQPVAMAMSVGAGLLLAGVSLKVAADAIRIAGPIAAALSLFAGAAVFSLSNARLARHGAAHRKRCGECVQQPRESEQPGSGAGIALGNALDALPEAMVLGIALRDPGVPLALVIAFSVGNLPVALSSTFGMRAAGRRRVHIFLVWIAIRARSAVFRRYSFLRDVRLSEHPVTPAAVIEIIDVVREFWGSLRAHRAAVLSRPGIDPPALVAHALAEDQRLPLCAFTSYEEALAWLTEGLGSPPESASATFA